MKKGLCLLLATMAVLLFALSCSSNIEPGDPFADANSGALIATDNAGNPTTNNYDGYGYEPYQYASAMYTTPGAMAWDIGGGHLLLMMLGGKLFEYDSTNGRTEYFCKDPVCKHDNDECVAGRVSPGLEAGDGVIAVTREKGVSLPMAENYWISVLKGGRFEFVAGPILKFRYYDGFFYAITPDWSLVRFPQEGGEPEVLLEEFYPAIMVPIKGYMYCWTYDGVGRIPLSGGEYETIIPGAMNYITDGEYLYYTREDGGVNRTDLDGNNVVTVFDDPEIWAHGICFYGEYIYYRKYIFDSEDGVGRFYGVYRVPKDRIGPVETIYDGGEYFWLYPLTSISGKLLAFDSSKFMLFDTETGELTKLLPG